VLNKPAGHFPQLPRRLYCRTCGHVTQSPAAGLMARLVWWLATYLQHTCKRIALRACVFLGMTRLLEQPPSLLGVPAPPQWARGCILFCPNWCCEAKAASVSCRACCPDLIAAGGVSWAADCSVAACWSLWELTLRSRLPRFSVCALSASNVCAVRTERMPPAWMCLLVLTFSQRPLSVPESASVCGCHLEMCSHAEAFSRCIK
jgi:hypothetical protein